MKQADVIIGGIYSTYVGDELVHVKVISAREPGERTYSKRTTYVVKRIDNDRVLPKSRTAAALHETVSRKSSEQSVNPT